jgi:hypothetical protein
MTDIILDTNIFADKKIDELICKIIEKCDRIYETNEVINKELPQTIFKNLPNLYYYYLKKLSKSEKFHMINIENKNISLPSNIEKELNNCNADVTDKNIVKLAYDRRNKTKEVYLVTNDNHIYKIKYLVENDKIHIRNLKEFIDEYCGQL